MVFVLSELAQTVSRHFGGTGHGRSMMHDGLGWLDRLAGRLQLARSSASIRNTATLFPGMFAQSSHSPSGVIARFCGPFPRLGSMAISVSLPVVADAVRRDAVVPAVRAVQVAGRPA